MKEEVMGGTAKIGIGSSIITKDGKFTFVLHPITDDALSIKPVQCPKLFDTIEEAKVAGSRALDVVMRQMNKIGKVTRLGDLVQQTLKKEMD
jgi:hypothetical protein